VDLSPVIDIFKPSNSIYHYYCRSKIWWNRCPVKQRQRLKIKTQQIRRSCIINDHSNICSARSPRKGKGNLPRPTPHLPHKNWTGSTSHPQDGVVLMMSFYTEIFDQADIRLTLSVLSSSTGYKQLFDNFVVFWCDSTQLLLVAHRLCHNRKLPIIHADTNIDFIMTIANVTSCYCNQSSLKPFKNGTLHALIPSQQHIALKQILKCLLSQQLVLRNRKYR
jgi:hypothetical protein